MPRCAAGVAHLCCAVVLFFVSGASAANDTCLTEDTSALVQKVTSVKRFDDERAEGELRISPSFPEEAWRTGSRPRGMITGNFAIEIIFYFYMGVMDKGLRSFARVHPDVVEMRARYPTQESFDASCGLIVRHTGGTADGSSLWLTLDHGCTSRTASGGDNNCFYPYGDYFIATAITTLHSVIDVGSVYSMEIDYELHGMLRQVYGKSFAKYTFSCDACGRDCEVLLPGREKLIIAMGDCPIPAGQLYWSGAFRHDQPTLTPPMHAVDFSVFLTHSLTNQDGILAYRNVLELTAGSNDDFTKGLSFLRTQK